MGSEGRCEQTLATDQDNGLIFAPPAGQTAESFRARLLPIAQRINKALDRAGYQLCKGEIMAGNPKWCMPLAAWRERFAAWIDSGSPDALLHGSIFFDLRPLGGNLELGHELRTWLLGRTANNPRFLHQLAGNALKNQPPLGFFGGLATARDGTIDLKLNGTMPFVDAARLFALAGPLDDTRTELRLRAGARRLNIPERESEGWIGAFQHLQGLRLRRQAECLDRGVDPVNTIALEQLNDYDRDCLRAAFAQARTLQRRVALDYGG
jgi:CBS domain-containing protein